MSLNNILSAFIILIIVVSSLIYGQHLLIPFVFALLIWFLVREIKANLNRVDFIREKFPRWIKSLITSILIFSILGFIAKVLSSSINSLAKSYKLYESNVENMALRINEMLNINVLEIIQKFSGDVDFGSILGSIFNSITDLLGNAFMIVLYVLFIFIEETYFYDKLKLVFEDQAQFSKISDTLEKIEKSIARYIGLKTLVSLITGILSYVALLIIGVDSPMFWAFLIFLLNFIPTIGSLVGTLFPAIFSMLQFGDFTPGLMVLLFVGIIQILVGNIIEPKLMGNSLNISSLAAIISLSFWGAIWGVTGMLLSIPVTVILVIIFAQFPKTKALAIMLSEKGKV